jgi:hypothetical protein
MRTSLKKDQCYILIIQPEHAKMITPKFHLFEHYVEQIEKFGSLLNGDTDATERLHCTVKDAFELTNKKGRRIAFDSLNKIVS